MRTIPACLTLLGLACSAYIDGAAAADRTPAPAGTPAAAIGLQLGPDTTVITEPLNSSGYPDYLAAMDRKLSAGVSKDENFWVLMWQAIGNAERSSEEHISAVERKLGITIAREPRLQDPIQRAGETYETPRGKALQEQWSQVMSRPWTRDEFPEFATWVDEHAEVLDLVHEAARRPKAYSPLITGDGDYPMVAVLLPHVQALRGAARVLVSRAMLRLGEGDVEGSWDDLVSMHLLAQHSEGGWTLIEALVGYAMRAMAQEPLGHWLANCGLNEEELQVKWAQLEPALRTRSLAGTVDAERYMYLDVVLALSTARTSSREVTGLLGPFNTVGIGDSQDAEALAQLESARQMMFQLILLGSDVNATLSYGNQVYDQLVQALSPPTHLERGALMQALEERLKQDARIAHDAGALVKEYLFASREDFQRIPGRVLTSMLVPAITAVETAHTRTTAYAATLEAAFRVQQHYAANEELPLSLDEASADDAAPLLDPFTGEPLKMLVSEQGVVIYSVGRNLRDDGGRPLGEPNADDVRAVLPIAP